MIESGKLLKVDELKKHFNLGKNTVLKAVDGVDFYIDRGETLGLVGESGCGKTTVGRTIIGLYSMTGGSVVYDGRDVGSMDKNTRIAFTKEVQMIFQDPYASLNPRMTVADIVGEGIDIHRLYRGKDRQDKIYETLALVGLSKEHANRFPHEFSGGQRQRVGIARALAVEPNLIICDEPISALDVSIQAQVVNLLEDLQSNLGLTYLFIAHDISMVEHISDRIAVMYLGRIVETAKSGELIANPQHPYTKALLSAVPVADPVLSQQRVKIKLTGDVPSPINTPNGCIFQGRCRLCTDVCISQTPTMRDTGSEHYVSCHMIK